MEIRVYALFVFILLFGLKSPSGFCVPEDERTLALKAAFVYNFTKHITFPELAEQEHFSITVITNKKLFDEIVEIFKDKKISEHPVDLNFINNVKEVSKKSQIVVLDSPAAADMPSILSLNALVISDDQLNWKSYSEINFYLKDNKLRFEINVKRAEEKGIKIGSRLLNLAKVVNE